MVLFSDVSDTPLLIYNIIMFLTKFSWNMFYLFVDSDFFKVLLKTQECVAWFDLFFVFLHV